MARFSEIPVRAMNLSRPSGCRHDFPLRVLLYSHDSVGLGHLRRNLAIAGEITATFPRANVMIVTGSPCATQFQLPANTDLIKVPSITKNEAGEYVTSSFGGSLETALAFRSTVILETYRSFTPDLVIIDHQATGLRGEAMAMLRQAKRDRALVFFGMRDVKDSPEVVKRSWNAVDVRWALNQCYDQICVYGMREVFNPVDAYAPMLDDVRRLDFTGFIVPEPGRHAVTPPPRKRKKVVATFGGGSDAAQRVEQYLEALAVGSASWQSLIITGPMMAADVVNRLTAKARTVQPLGLVKIKRFHRNLPKLLRQADAVVSMAGYNSCAEILQRGVPAVLLPRSFPRKEQLIRAMRLAQLGWVRTLPEDKPDPYHLYNAVEGALASPRRSSTPADLDGLGNLCRIIQEHLQSSGVIRCCSPTIERVGSRSGEIWS